MPKLSIIIPTFNSGASIEKCLGSVAGQTFTAYEVIIQDGGSSDGTVEKVAKFHKANAALNLRLLVEKDGGPYDAMNKGARRARGKWIYFLGSDDELYDRDVFAKVMTVTEVGTHDVVYGNVRVIGETSWAKENAVYDGVFTLEKFLTRNICHQAIFYRTKFFRRMGKFNPDYVACADWDFNMRCWSKTRFQYVDVTIANFYGGGLSSRTHDERFSRDVASKVLKYFRLSIYDPLVNTPDFAGFGYIVRMQQSAMASQGILSRIRKAIRPFRIAL